jgi:hypothetical protein
MTPRARAEADRIEINRAPVLTLWAAVVAERLGFDRAEALTLGRAVAGLNAQTKGRRLGLFEPASADVAKRRRAGVKSGERLEIELLQRAVPAVRTAEGVRALESGGRPSDPAAVERYLEGKFADSLAPARRALSALAGSIEPAALAESAFALYESFRPAIPAGTRGWGAKGVLDLERVRALAAKRRG